MYGQTVRGNSLLVRVWAIREAVCGNGKYLHRESEGHVTGESKTNTHHVANPGVSPAVACCAARSSAAASPDSSSRFRASPKVSSKGQYFDCKEKCQSICVRRVLDVYWTMCGQQGGVIGMCIGRWPGQQSPAINLNRDRRVRGKTGRPSLGKPGRPYLVLAVVRERLRREFNQGGITRSFSGSTRTTRSSTSRATACHHANLSHA
jgi:hypothetical protein